MRTDFRLLVRTTLFIGYWAVCGCSSDLNLPQGDCDLDGLFVTLLDGEGNTPTDFLLTLDLDGEDIVGIYCSDENHSSGLLECTGGGVVLRSHPQVVGIAVKSRGYRTVRTERRVSYLEMSPSNGHCGDRIHHARVDVTLNDLTELEENEDYRTGFDSSRGLADFEEMGVQMPREMGASIAVKFYIEGLDGEPQVYFQNTRRHPLHYAFVRGVLGRPYTLDEYEGQTYYGEDRIGMAGSVILAPDLLVDSVALGDLAQSPLTIEFFPRDNLSPRLALLAHQLLEERMGFVPLSGTRHRLFYIPAGDTRDAELRQHQREFEAMGSLWLHREELYGNITVQLLNAGSAYGTLRRMTPEDLVTTPVSYRDILVLTRLPNDLPIVGGTITEELQTPLAHVNVAARARGTPNMALIGATQNETVAPLLESLVRFEVTATDYSLDPATLDEAEVFWATLIPEEPTVPTADVERTGLLSFSELHFEDSIAVGVKAANLAELRQLLGDLTPDGFAVPFHYYDHFMASATIPVGLCLEAYRDCVEEGRNPSVCESIEEFCEISEADGDVLNVYLDRLLGDTTFTSDSSFREAALDGLRYLIHHIPVDESFGEALDQHVFGLLGYQTARLRSSTNAEDLENFSGAGLYRSESAVVGSSQPPSDRIRRIWASVWNWRAFEERSFWNIDHRAVRMGVAVHRSFPDEAANGVLITRNLADPVVPEGFYVNVQLGEVSVTNPANGALPEVFSIIPTAGRAEVVRQRYSSLSPDQPIMTDDEIQALYHAAQQVQYHFALLYGESPFEVVLDLEFKLEGAQRSLIIKQVRPYFER